MHRAKRQRKRQRKRQARLRHEKYAMKNMPSVPQLPTDAVVGSDLDTHTQTVGVRAELSAKAIRLSAILWPSFLLAGVATMIFFAFIDPHELNLISFPGIEFSRELGYSLGFFLFWLISAASSYLTAVLLGQKL